MVILEGVVVIDGCQREREHFSYLSIHRIHYGDENINSLDCRKSNSDLEGEMLSGRCNATKNRGR